MTYMEKYLKELFDKHQNKDQGMQVDQGAGTQSQEEEEKELRKKMRYEYYVHYLGVDRRLDRWVTEDFIKIDMDEINR